jgi:hypothetical protein
MSAQVHQADQGTLVRWEFAAAVTLTRDDEHRDPLDQGVGQAECQKTEPTRLLCLWVETSNTSPNGTGASCVAGMDPVTRSVATLKELSEPLSSWVVAGQERVDGLDGAADAAG